MELWKDIPGYEGCYQVSDLGNVRSVRRKNCYGRECGGLVLKQQKNKNTGYWQVGLNKNGKAKRFTVHRLVAMTFIPTTSNTYTVNHKNENKDDNRLDNLEWLSLTENLKYGTHNMRATINKPDMHGERHFNYGKRGSSAVSHKGRVIGVNKYDPTDIVEFDTAATASRELGISSGQLCDVINGKAKSCGGYYWSREDG